MLNKKLMRKDHLPPKSFPPVTDILLKKAIKSASIVLKSPKSNKTQPKLNEGKE